MDTFLKTLIERHPCGIPVDAFMEAVLYDPVHGYYRVRDDVVGARGDFSTSPTLNPWLARALGARLKKLGSDLGIWNWIEIGAGDGSLALEILRSVGRWTRRKIRYHIVEVSEGLLKRQQKRLTGSRVLWHATPKAALNACQGEALLVSNELVDAFPAVRLEYSRGSWRELLLQADDQGALSEFPSAERATEERLRNSVVTRWNDAPEGQRVEVHASYHDWLAEWIDALRRGVLITVDYGDVFPHLYYRRVSGSLRAYRSQQRLTGDGVFAHAGNQDITADVNFDDLRQWGGKFGLSEGSFQTQRVFVLSHAPKAEKDSDPAVQQWLAPEGAGSAFRVLEQWK